MGNSLSDIITSSKNTQSQEAYFNFLKFLQSKGATPEQLLALFLKEIMTYHI
jgi:hypothetical protein